MVQLSCGAGSGESCPSLPSSPTQRGADTNGGQWFAMSDVSSNPLISNGLPEPKEATRTRPRRRGRVKVFGNWCKGCGICIAFCPQHVFDVGPDGHPIVAREEQCTACNWCYYRCPDSAIIVEPLAENDLSAEQGGEVES